MAGSLKDKHLSSANVFQLSKTLEFGLKIYYFSILLSLTENIVSYSAELLAACLKGWHSLSKVTNWQGDPKAFFAGKCRDFFR